MKKFLKIFKEELLIVPLFLIGFYALNYLLSHLFPTGAFFDPNSQLENLYWWGMRVLFGFWFTFLVIRVSFPGVYKHYQDNFYLGFDKLPPDIRNKFTIAIVITVLLCVALIGSAKGETTREKLVKVLASQINVREIWGDNRGPEVDKYLLSVGVKPPASWCGAFVGYNLTQLGVKNPNSAWSPNYALKQDIIWTPKQPRISPLPGDVPTFWHSSLGRVGHVGFYIKEDKSGFFITEEGNTNNNGSFNGDGVYFKKRDPAKIYAISRYIKP